MDQASDLEARVRALSEQVEELRALIKDEHSEVPERVVWGLGRWVGLAFLILKLTGTLHWAWSVVLMPWWLPVATTIVWWGGSFAYVSTFKTDKEVGELTDAILSKVTGSGRRKRTKRRNGESSAQHDAGSD